MQLRPYQQDLEARIYAEWRAGAQNVMAVAPVGSGKTVLFAKILADEPAESCAIAHRQELVSQISLALARYGVRHRVIGPKPVIRFIIWLHHMIIGRTFYDPNARCGVAGVDTLIKRGAEFGPWLRKVRKWVTDEGHHVLANNKWGSACQLFPNALGLAVTATPSRADGKGLGRHADGLMDSLVVGPSMRDLIEWGYLTDYRIWCPPSDIDYSQIKHSQATGDYTQQSVKNAIRKSHVVGDVVKHYQRIAPGRLGITFASDVETASDVALQFQAAGISAEVLSAKSPERWRTDVLKRFAAGEIRQVTNVDLFGEGFDLPAIDAVSMARPTESFALFVQQAGRALRPVYAPGMPLDTPEQRKAAIAAGPKPYASIIDHVGNVQRHAVAREIDGRTIIDICHREWSLDGREKKKRGTDDDVIPLTVCLNPECMQVYEKVKPACPYCSLKPIPQSRAAPEFVDGDLTELDPAALDTIASEIQRIDGPAQVQNLTGVAALGARKQHRLRQEAQDALRDALSWWGGYQRALGRSDAESYRRFYHRYGVDVMTAQTYGRREAEELAAKINQELGR